MTAEEQLQLAREQLARVLAAWDPPDWSDLALYGFFCLENAVCAAATHIGIPVKRTHPGKAEAAMRLAQEHGFPEIQDLLRKLNDARKAASYGDTVRPQLDAESVATTIEQYVKAVESVIVP